MPGLYDLSSNANVAVTNTTGLYQLSSNVAILNSAGTLLTLLSNSGNVSFGLTSTGTQVQAWAEIAPNNYGNVDVAAFLPTYGGDINASTVFGQGLAAQGYDYVQMQYSNNAALPVSPYDIGTGSWLYLDSGGATFQSNTTGTFKQLVINNDGGINAQGNITAPYFIGDGSQLTGIVGSYGNANVAAYLPTYSGTILVDRVNFTNSSGIIEQGQDRITITGNAEQVNTGAYFNDTSEAVIFAYTDVNITSNVQGSINPTWTFDQYGNLSAPGAIGAVGNITAPYYFGNGSQLTGIVGSYGNTNVQSYLSSPTLAPTAPFNIGNAMPSGSQINIGNTVSQTVINGNNGAMFIVGSVGGNVSISTSNGLYLENTDLGFAAGSPGNINLNYTSGNQSSINGANQIAGQKLITTTGLFWANGVNYSTTLTNVYGNTQVNAYLSSGVITNISGGSTLAINGVNTVNIQGTNTGVNLSGAIINLTDINNGYGNTIAKGNLTVSNVATVGNLITTNGIYWANGAAYSSGSSAATSFSGNLAGNVLYDSVNQRTFANAFPLSQLTPIVGGAFYNYVANGPVYTGGNLASAGAPTANQSNSGFVTGLIQTSNVALVSSNQSTNNRNTVGGLSAIGVQLQPGTWNAQDRVRAMLATADINLNNQAWGASSNTTTSLAALTASSQVTGTGSAGSMVGAISQTIIAPSSGAGTSTNVGVATGTLNFVTMQSLAGTQYKGNVGTARGYGIIVQNMTANLVVQNAFGLHIHSGWAGAGATSATTAQSRYAVLNEDIYTNIGTGGNIYVGVASPTAYNLTNSATLNTAANITVGLGGIFSQGNITVNGTGTIVAGTAGINSAGNIIAANISTSGFIQAGTGFYTPNVFNGTFTDGIVVDYQTGNGRISVGSADGINFYNGGVGVTPLFNISSAGAITTVGKATLGNVVTTSGVFWANGVSYVANLATASALQTLDANVGSYEIATNANLGTATTNITTLFSNAATQATAINTLDANVGAFETYANLTFSTSTYSNVDVGGYLPIYTGNIALDSITNATATNAWQFGSLGALTLPDLGTIQGIDTYNQIRLQPGYGTVIQSGSDATVYINTGLGGSTKSWVFDNVGNLMLPTNYSTINYANGTSILDGIGGGSYANVNVSEYLPHATGYDDAWLMPTGGNSARPTFAANGHIRFNTDYLNPEWFNGADSTWYPFYANVAAPTPPPPGSYSVDYLVVAGGGSGGSCGGGGGGAGGLLTSTATFNSSTAYTITVGAGATAAVGSAYSGGTQLGTNGSDSEILGSGLTTVTALGGGGGGAFFTLSASAGGSGGGANGGGPGSINYGGAGTSGQGYAGGNINAGPPYGGSGAGGGGASGTPASANEDIGSAGADGVASSITGSSIYYAGGGGGGSDYLPVKAGGAGGGGAGAQNTANATDGTANTGGGGGGCRNGTYDGSVLSGAGGSGVVILRMATTNYSGTTTGSPTVTTDGSDTILTYTASGSYTA